MAKRNKLTTTGKEGEGKMYSKILVTVVWTIGIISCFIMKKIQPDNVKLYAVYVGFVCVAFTLVCASYSQTIPG